MSTDLPLEFQHLPFWRSACLKGAGTDRGMWTSHRYFYLGLWRLCFPSSSLWHLVISPEETQSSAAFLDHTTHIYSVLPSFMLLPLTVFFLHSLLSKSFFSFRSELFIL